MARKRQTREPEKFVRAYPGGHLGDWEDYPNSNPTTISALCVTPADELWAGAGSKLLVYRNQHWREVSVPPASLGFRSLVWFRERLWCMMWCGGAGTPLAVCDRYTCTAVSSSPLPSNAMVRDLIVDTNDWLWVGTFEHGLWCTQDGQSWEYHALPGGGQGIGALHADAVGNLWVAEIGERPASRPLHRWYQGSWQTLPLPTQYRSFRYQHSLTTDQRGNVWVGSDGYGVWKWDGQDWVRFGSRMVPTRPGLPAGSVSDICCDHQQRIWVATHIDIGVYEDEQWWNAVVAPEGITAETVLSLWITEMHSPTCLHLDRHGRLWIGTTTQKVGWIDTHQVSIVDPEKHYHIVPYRPHKVPVLPVGGYGDVV